MKDKESLKSLLKSPLKSPKMCAMLIVVGIIFAVPTGYLIKEGKSGSSDIDSIINNHNIDGTKEIRFIVVGDPHVKNNSNRESERLKKVVSFVNNSDVDFVVFLGDITDNGTNKEFRRSKNILDDLTKPYYIIPGNHDIRKSEKTFRSYYGPMEHVEKIKGYQLIFAGIKADRDENGNLGKLYWTFNFNNTKINKKMPTIVFTHGPVVGPPQECFYCNWGEDVLGYGKSMQPELDKFTDLIGVYSGHVHYDSDQMINGTRHITVNGLTTIRLADLLPIVRASGKIGYSIVYEDRLYFKLVSYNNISKTIGENETDETENNINESEMKMNLTETDKNEN